MLFSGEVSVEFYVFDTDYDTYALVFGCQDLPRGRSEQFGHLLLRDSNRQSDSEIQVLLDKFRQYTGLELEDHTRGCSDSDYP